MLFFSRDFVLRELSMEECINAVEEAFIYLHQEKSFHSLRKRVHLPGGEIGWGNLFSMMPCYYDENYFGGKIFSVFPDNTGTELPTHQGLVMLFDSKRGCLLACADAHAITELRTAATTALATKLLSREDSHWCAFIGAGGQAYSHLDALMAVRPLDKISIYNRTLPRAQRFAAHILDKYGIEAQICSSAREAAYGADIVCTVTTAGQPLLFGDDIAPGTHINAVGACAPCFRELSTDLVVKASLFGDCREAMMNEPGDFLIPLKEGAIQESHLKGDLSDVVGGSAGRSSREEITIFKSLGIANEDVAAIKRLYERFRNVQAPGRTFLEGV